MNWRGFTKLLVAEAKQKLTEENSIDIQLSSDDLYAMSPKYSVCVKCNASYRRDETCVSCALRWATIAQLTLETTRAYNASWFGEAYHDKHLPS